MVLSSCEPPSAAATHDAADELAAIWHELECGSYTADLALWRELAASLQGAPGSVPVLDIGAGTGRVTLDLAARGHRVWAFERDGQLVAALRARSQEQALDVQSVCGDARTFSLERRDFGLCILAMQTVQLLGGEAGRMSFLRRAGAHLRPGGLIACAIVTALEAFDCAAGELGPPAESARVAGTLYASRATRVELDSRRILIERERHVVSEGAGRLERNIVELDRLSPAQLRSEGVAAGLTPQGELAITPTTDYAGSEVVLLSA